MSRGWWTGQVWHPKIQVLKPGTSEPLPLDEPPTVRVLGPDGYEAVEQASIDEDDEESFTLEIPLTRDGDWTAVVLTPPPHKDVAVATIYAKPLPMGGER